MENREVPPGVLPDGGRILPLLSPRQAEGLAALQAYVQAHQGSPTLGELAQALSILALKDEAFRAKKVRAERSAALRSQQANALANGI